MSLEKRQRQVWQGSMALRPWRRQNSTMHRQDWSYRSTKIIHRCGRSRMWDIFVWLSQPSFGGLLVLLLSIFCAIMGWSHSLTSLLVILVIWSSLPLLFPWMLLPISLLASWLVIPFFSNYASFFFWNSKKVRRKI